MSVFHSIGQGLLVAFGFWFGGALFARLLTGDQPTEIEAHGPGGLGFRFAFDAAGRALRTVAKRFRGLRTVVADHERRLRALEEQTRRLEETSETGAHSGSASAGTENGITQE